MKIGNNIEKYVGIRYKDDPLGHFRWVFPVKYPYKLPYGTDLSKLERKLISVTPQDQPENLENISTVTEIDIDFGEAIYDEKQTKRMNTVIPDTNKTRICKKCKNIMALTIPCCEDRAAGIKEKWSCNVCRLEIIVRDRDNR